MTKRRELRAEEAAESSNLRRIWDERAGDLGLSQADASREFGFANPSAISQYLNSRIPLNFETTVKFANLLKVPVESISQRYADMMSSPKSHEAIRTRLGVPVDDDLIDVTPEMRKIVGDCDWIVTDKAAKSLSDGLFLVNIGGRDIIIKSTLADGVLTVVGASKTPMSIPIQAAELITVIGKVTHKIYKC